MIDMAPRGRGRGGNREPAFDLHEHQRNVVGLLMARAGRMSNRELIRQLAALDPPIVISEAAMSDRLRPTWTDPTRPQPPFTTTEIYGIIRVFGADPNIFFAPVDLVVLPDPTMATQRGHRTSRNNRPYYGSSGILVPESVEALTLA